MEAMVMAVRAARGMLAPRGGNDRAGPPRKCGSSIGTGGVAGAARSVA
jgi:hypothetical protein